MNYDWIYFAVPLFLFLLLIYLNQFVFGRAARRIFLRKIYRLKTDNNRQDIKTRLDINENIFQSISRELHDNVGLSLTLAKLSLVTADLQNEIKAKQSIDLAVDCISQTIDTIQDIGSSFNSSAIAEIGLVNALEREAEKIRQSLTHSIKIEKNGEALYFEPEIQLVLFRIAQEALTNILKHAEAKNIVISLDYHKTDLCLSISDDGKGFEPEKKKDAQVFPATGLINIKKRAELIGGRLTIHSQPHSGTTILITVFS